MTLRARKEGELLTVSPDRLTPAEQYVRDLGPGHYMLSEVAEQVGVTSQTLRRLIKDPNKKIHAPSFIGQMSGMSLYIFTDEDVAEIRAHYQSRYEGFERRDAERGRGRPKTKKDE